MPVSATRRQAEPWRSPETSPADRNVIPLATVTEVEYERRLDEKRKTVLTLDVMLPVTFNHATLMETIEKRPGVRRIRMTQPS